MSGDRKILLFYDGYEMRAAPDFPGHLYAQGRRAARYVVRNLRGQQVRTGFYTAFRSLALSLRKAGYDVAINDFAYARAHPDHPIGLCGFPGVLAKTDALPNPRIFGPGDFGPPDGVGAVAKDERFKILTHPSEWFVDLYRPSCGDKLAVMFVGIDLDEWRSQRNEPKTRDVLIYDKIRWRRDTLVAAVLDRVRARLDAQGRTYQVLRYGAHNLAHFKAALKASRTMVFLCEHETQGLAYQEALAADVPVLVWDEHKLIDPFLAPFAEPTLAVRTAPYFDERCGRTFTLDAFDAEFDAFWRDRETYQPRAYVADHLSLERAAANYAELYNRLRK